MFNLDATGLWDWEDSTPKPIFIPTHLGDSMIHYPVHHPVRRQILLCCISASGNAYCLLLVSAEESVSQILDMGIGYGIGLRIRIAPFLYVMKERFLE
jgi:hypothetical protein